MANIAPAVLKLIDELDGLRKSRDDHWQVPRIEGEVLYHIALACNARTIVEIGTSYGFSGLFWGAALQRTGGHLHTIDASVKKVESAKSTFDRAGLSSVVTNHFGDAREIIPKIAGPVDLAFIDADKPSTRAYFDLIWPKIRGGGFVLTDNASTHREELADFVKHVRSRADASSIELAVGNGVEWTIKI